MEDGGGDGTAGSHWSKHRLYLELMTGETGVAPQVRFDHGSGRLAFTTGQTHMLSLQSVGYSPHPLFRV